MRLWFKIEIASDLHNLRQKKWEELLFPTCKYIILENANKTQKWKLQTK